MNCETDKVFLNIQFKKVAEGITFTIQTNIDKKDVLFTLGHVMDLIEMGQINFSEVSKN